MNRLLILLLAATACAQTPPPPKVELTPPQSFPHAGITLALPKGYASEIPRSIFDVCRAVRTERDEPVLALTLSAWLLPAEMSLEDFVRNIQPSPMLFKKQEIRSLTLVQVAGVEGALALMTYEFRQVETTALRLCFMRPLEQPITLPAMAAPAVPATAPAPEAARAPATAPGAGPASAPATMRMQMAYALTVECKRPFGREAHQVLTALAPTLALAEPRHPALTPVLGPELVESQANGYRFRIPAGWKVDTRDLELVHCYQTDYLQPDSQRWPKLHVSVAKSGETDPRALTQRALLALRAAIGKRKHDFRVLSEGRADVGPLAGYQYVGRETDPAGQGPPLLSVQRTACTAGRVYVLTLLVHDGVETEAQAVLDAVAKSFQPLTPAPTTEPAK